MYKGTTAIFMKIFFYARRLYIQGNDHVRLMPAFLPDTQLVMKIICPSIKLRSLGFHVSSATAIFRKFRRVSYSKV